MLDVYDLLKFDNPNGGVWKQGFNIKVDSSRFSQSNKLKIFIIKHSHNDPGWLKTFGNCLFIVFLIYIIDY
jgi:alpha-mannosidase II